MLTLQKDNFLSREEVWLKKTYSNIVYRLTDSTISTSSEFDPFVTKFMGIDSIEYEKAFQYQALLETTSYFWASKGGRGTLLEKIIASLGNSYSSNGATLSKIVSILLSKFSYTLTHNNQNSSQVLIKGNVKRLKFDLVNIIDDNLILLELTNRVDSGGTAAREEALRKKFFAICRIIENEEKIFVYAGKDYDFAELLSILGINKLELYLGLLFNINGKEATINADRSYGFYSSSKTHMKNYLSESHPNINVEFDESNLKLFFKKRSLLVRIGMLYGDEVIQRFSSKEYHLSKLLEKVFSKSWDDIWLVFNIAISQRAMLLRNKNNHILQIKNLKENDEYFDRIFTKFCNYSLETEFLNSMIEYMQKKMDLSDLPMPATANEDNSYLADCLYAFASYIISRIISRSNLIKTKKKMADISMDVNKVVLSKE